MTAGVVLEGPSRVEVKRWLDETRGQWIDARHDGYARRYGVLHRRTLRLSEDGAVLQGEDRISPARKTAMAAGKSLAVRFHLHPAVRAKRDDATGQVVLTLPSGEQWRFEAAGRTVDLEDSIFFAVPGGARPTMQIALQASLAESEPIGWSFSRSRPTQHAAASGPDGRPNSAEPGG